MPSQFFGLNIAYSGLTSYQASLNTTGNNIANVETKGYSRQEAIQRAGDALRTYSSYGMAGSGVVTTDIQQMRNTYYDAKYWNNNTNLGQYNLKDYYMKQIQNIYMETETIDGFNAIYAEKMFNALQSLLDNPGDIPTRSQFISTTEALAEYFNTMSTNMLKMQEDCNAEILNQSNEINSIASKVSVLNQQINVIELTGHRANELRDERALLMDELSKICSIDIIETPIINSNDPNSPSGIFNFTVKIGGQTLVSGSEYNKLQCVARDYKMNQSDAQGLYDVKWSNGLELNLYSGALGGTLSGLVQMRDGNNAENFRGTAVAADPAQNKVTIGTTESYLSDINKCTLPPSGVINIGDVEYKYTGWEFDPATNDYTFQLAPGETLRPNAVGKTTEVGESVDYQGIPYYMEQMNEWVRIYSKAVNDILKADGHAAKGTDGELLFAAKDNLGNELLFTDSDQAKVSSGGDNYYRLTAGNFVVNRNMIEHPDRLTTTATPNGGNEANDTLTKINNLFRDTDQISFRGASSQDFLKCLLSDIALNASSAQTFKKNFENVGNAVQNQRLSVMGVDNDEEAAGMVRFQNAFNLNSKMVQILSEVYDRLILQTGV